MNKNLKTLDQNKKSLLKKITKFSSNPYLETDLLIAKAFNKDKTWLYTQNPQTLVPLGVQIKIDNYLKQKTKNIPLAYIIGFKEFRNKKYLVDKNVLIPRPETEELIDIILSKIKQNKLEILEVGTGSGVIPISILIESKFKLKITSIEISINAIKLAKQNAKRLLDNQKIKDIDFIHKNVKSFKTDKKYNLIVSNPPYIPKKYLKELPAEVKKEPLIALDGGEDGFKVISAIFKIAKRNLSLGGYIIFEIDTRNYQQLIKKYLEYFPSGKYIVNKDLNNKPRFFIGQPLPYLQ